MTQLSVYRRIYAALLVLPALVLAAVTLPAGAQTVTFAGVQTTLPASGLVGPTGIASNGAGDIFIADSDNDRVVKIPAGCTSSACQTTVGSGLSAPSGVAADSLGGIDSDGRGNVYIADTNNGRVVKVPAGCTSSTCQVNLATGLNVPSGVAVDPLGNVYVADTGNSRVVKIPAGCTSTSCQSTVGSGLNNPFDVAVDPTGDVFIADTANVRVVEVPAGCTTSSCQTTVGSGFSSPAGVAVDGAGNVFVGDPGNSQVVKIPAGCTSSSCQLPVSSSLSLPFGVSVDTFGDVFIADSGTGRALQVQFNPNFGAVSVGSSTSLTLPFNINSYVTLGAAPRVVTQGVAGLDFTPLGTSTCTGAQSAGSVCTVQVQFQPIAPGGRLGAVQLLDDSGNLMASAFVRGLGQSPAVAFPNQGALITVASGFSAPGSVVDPAGDVFVVDASNGLVREIPAGCAVSSCWKTAVSGLSGPTSVALDGAGDLLIGESNGMVVTVPAGCTSNSCWTSVQVNGTSYPVGVAVDGTGNVFVANLGLVELPAGCASIACQIPLDELTALQSAPRGVAADEAGGVYSLDNGVAFRLPAGCYSLDLPCYSKEGFFGGGEAIDYYGVAVDAAGDFFAQWLEEDVLLESSPSVPAAVSNTAPVGSAVGFTLDATGDYFFAANNDSPTPGVYEQQNSQHPPIVFLSSVVPGAVSAPQTITVQNIGNQPLTFAGFAASANFSLDAASTTCSTSSPLAPQGTCNVGVVCSPAVTGSLNGTLTLTDNALNGSPATQQVSLACTAGSSPPPPVITSPDTVNLASGVFSSFTVTTLGEPVPHLSIVPGSPIPSGVTFVDNGNGTATISGIPNVNCAEESTFINIVAQNGVLPNATQTLTINVASDYPCGGSPPAIFSASSATFVANQFGSFTVNSLIESQSGPTVNIADTSPTPSLSLSGTLPTGITFVAHEDGSATISGTPTEAAAGSYALTITAQNGVPPNATQNFTLTVQPTIGLASPQSYVNFSNVNVGSSNTMTLNFAIASAVTLDAPIVLTEGSSNLDFTLSGTPTCTGSQDANTKCTVTVQFAPTAAGPRLGAVELTDSTGKVRLTTYLQGVGLAPVAAFEGGAQTTVAAGLNGPQGLAVDSAGDLLIGDSDSNKIVKVPAGCADAACQTKLGSGLYLPAGVAVDGAGNVLIADPSTGVVVNALANCTSDCELTVGSGTSQASGVTVDGEGNTYIADTGNNRVLVVPPDCTSTTCENTLGLGLNQPVAAAVDGAGDVFISDAGNNRVLEVPAGCTIVGCQITIASGLSNPQGVAVDAAGDVFIADSGNNRVLEVPAGCTSTSCQSTVGTGLSQPTGVAVDAAGNVFIADTGNFRVVEVQNSQPSGLNFGTVLDGSSSAAQTVTIQNIGNQPLTFASFTVDKNFEVDSSTTTCSTSSPLSPGATCNVGVICSPTTFSGTLGGNLSIFDNTLNQTQGKQQVSLSCTASGQAPLITSANSISFTAGTAGSFTVTTTGSPTPSLSRSGTLPAGVSFVDNHDGTATLSGTPAASAGGAYIITIIASNAVSPNATQSFTLTVNAAPQITSAGSVAFTPGTAGTFSVTATGYPTPALAEAGALPSGVTFVDNQNGTATLSGTPAGGTSGTYSLVLTASNGISPNATQSFTLTVNQATQTITFALPSSVQALTSLNLTGTASSGLAVTYVSNTPTICSVSGSTAQFLTSGACTITASQAGNSNYSAATAISATTMVTAASQTITFTLPASVPVQTSLPLTGSASSGLPVAYTSTTPTICSVSGSTAQFLTSGTCTISASQAGNSNYSAATAISASTMVTAASQTITFSLPASVPVQTSLPLTGSASSGLPVAYTSTTPTICSVSGSTAQFLTSGTCTISASQAGNSVYGAATPVAASTMVTAASQTITFTPLPSSEPQGSTLTLSAKSTSGLAVSFTSLTPSICSVSGSSATLLKAGTCTIQASQPGNASYAPATPVSQSVLVTAAFTLTATPNVETVRRGNIAAFLLELQAAGGFNGKVTLTCSGGPSGSYCADFPMTVSFQKGFALALSGIYFPPTTPPGTYTLTFTGTSGAVSNTTTAEFIVEK